MAQYTAIMLHFLVCTMLLCGLLMYVQRRENPKQRKVAAAVLLLGAAIMSLKLLEVYNDGIPDTYPVLPIANLYGGFLSLLILFLYPVEVVNPGWLKFKTLLYLIAPMIIVSLIITIFSINFRNLHSLSEMMLYIGEPNVWFRIVILLVFIIPYSILLLFVPYNWRNGGVDLRWIRACAIGTQIIGALYITFMLTGSVVVSAIHLTYCTLFFIFMTYQELFLRLLPPVVRSVNKRGNVVAAVPVESSLWSDFINYCTTNEPWRSPDITINEIAKAIGSNRTTLATELHEHGFGSFHDFIAYERIEAFCEMVKSEQVGNINDAFFAVGFRSRTTAYQRFKEFIGDTPLGYIKQIKTNGQ